jgi:hypothetical protein
MSEGRVMSDEAVSESAVALDSHLTWQRRRGLARRPPYSSAACSGGPASHGTRKYLHSLMPSITSTTNTTHDITVLLCTYRPV